MFKICYYDNMTCENNPLEVIYGFVRALLEKNLTLFKKAEDLERNLNGLLQKVRNI